VTPPPHSPALVTINETEAEATIISDVHANRQDPKAVARYDLDSLTATYRVRGGTVASLEACRAIFVARNRGLVRAGRKIYPPSIVGAPIAMHSTDIVTLAWLKCPREIPDLPRLRLAADAYAAARPSRILVEKYTDVLVDLRDRRQISEADLYEMRYATEAHTILMQRTYGNEDRLDEPTVLEIIQDTRQAVREAAEATARMELRAVEDDLRQSRASAESLAMEAKHRGDRLEDAQTTIRVLRAVIAAFMALIAIAAGAALWVWWSEGPLVRTGIAMAVLLLIAFAVAIALSRRRAAALLGAVGLLLGIGSALYQVFSSGTAAHPKTPAGKHGVAKP
jgi:uncharacterized membrane protein